MPLDALIDTGAILAIVDAEDRWHSACLDALQRVRIPMLTTEAVLTEAFHLFGRSAYHIEQAWRFVRSGSITVQGLTNSDFPALHQLMLKYVDRPMDFADATLVHLATLKDVGLILTVDYNDFATYRFAGNRRFEILPQVP